MSRVPVFVISLARAQERRDRICAHLRRLGVDFDLLDGVDGQRIPPDRRRAMQADGRDFHPGVIGCYLSHMDAYRRLLAGGSEVALILEDDARLDPRFVPALQQGLRSLDFDYCFLDYHERNPQGPVCYDRSDGVAIFPGFTAYTTHAGPTGTHAYLVTRRAAARRLDFELPIRVPLDIYTTLPYRPHFRALVSPFGAGVSEDSLHSLISDHVGRLRLRWLRRLPGYYGLRELLDPKRWRARRLVGEMRRSGALPAGGDWVPLPPGRRITG